MDDAYPSWLKQLISNCFSFSYSLIPDELQSQQLVIDSYQFVTINAKKLFNEELSELEENKKVVYDQLLKKIFELAEKRTTQLRGQDFSVEDNEEDNSLFYTHLNIKQRSALFLYHKQNLTIERIVSILGIKRSECIGLLHTSRHVLSQSIDNYSQQQGK